VLVFPDAQVGSRDASFRRYGGGFLYDERGASYGTAAQVYKVPVIGKAIDGRVLTHGGYDNAVLEGDGTEGTRSEEDVHGIIFLMAGREMEKGDRSKPVSFLRAISLSILPVRLLNLNP
jgi:hypothetical protein